MRELSGIDCRDCSDQAAEAVPAVLFEILHFIVVFTAIDVAFSV